MDCYQIWVKYSILPSERKLLLLIAKEDFAPRDKFGVELQWLLTDPMQLNIMLENLNR